MSNEAFSNNASTTLGSALSSVATTATVATGTGSDFPVIAGSEFFTATLWAAGNTTGIPNEIVRVTARVGDTMTIERAQEGTTAQNWAVGDTFAHYATAAFLSGLATDLDIQQQTGNSAVDTGTANAGVITLNPAPASLVSLLFSPIRVKKIASPNTGAYELNINGFGNQPVTFLGAALTNDQLLGSQVFEVYWDGASLELLSPPANVVAGGDLVGTYPDPALAASVVTAGAYTNTSVTFDAKGRAMTAASGAAPVLTKFFELAGQAVATNVNAAHGFGSVPKMIAAFLVCVSPNAGYSAGDEVALPSTTYTGAGGGAGSFMGVSANGTLVEMKCSSTATISVGDGTSQYITPGDWTVTLRAWA